VPNFGRFRVNMFLALGAVRAVLRSSVEAEVRGDRLPEVLEQLSMERRGLLLVTGITGSGKSTTLAAMVDYINRTRNDHIITIEDPIEFTHDDIGCVVSQREIGHDSPSFATALRAALREDPDVILVGEMRDPETMSVALHAAETGHLVFSTLHTLNASETVNRIIGTFPPHQEQQIRDQLAAVIVGIVSQRLIPKIGGEGRIPAVEILVGTGAIKDCIRRQRTPEIPAFIARQSQYGRPVPAEALSGRIICTRPRGRRRPTPTTSTSRCAASSRRQQSFDMRDRSGTCRPPAAPSSRDQTSPRVRAGSTRGPAARGRRPPFPARVDQRDMAASAAAWRARGRCDDVVADLTARGYLDDEAFARHWARVRRAATARAAACGAQGAGGHWR
jgi:twitching motility protein PilT